MTPHDALVVYLAIGVIVAAATYERKFTRECGMRATVYVAASILVAWPMVIYWALFVDEGA